MSDNELDLRLFVKTALLDVLGAVRDVQSDSDVGRFVAPVGLGSAQFPPDSGVVHSNRTLLTTIKFDVAVTAERQDTAKGGGKIGINVIGASLSGESGTRSENVSRIQFAVPLKFPRYGATSEED